MTRGRGLVSLRLLRHTLSNRVKIAPQIKPASHAEENRWREKASKMATPVGLGITTHSQHLGIVRSLTDDFLRARAASRRSHGDQSDVSDSEDVRWVSEERERVRERRGGGKGMEREGGREIYNVLQL